MITNMKKYLQKCLKILSSRELRILPAYLAYSFVLASIPLLTIIVVIAGFFSISLETIISLISDFLPSYISNVIVGAISGKNFDLSVGFLNVVTLAIASKGMYAIVEASNSLYNVKSSSSIKNHLKSISIMLIIIALLLFLLIVPMLGGGILDLLESYNVRQG